MKTLNLSQALALGFVKSVVPKIPGAARDLGDRMAASFCNDVVRSIEKELRRSGSTPEEARAIIRQHLEAAP